MSNRIVIFVTTDGKRPNELNRLFSSLCNVENALVILLLQDMSPLPRLPNNFAPEISYIQVQGRLSLSSARNMMIDHIEVSESRFQFSSDSYIFFADDDCWYSDDFFFNLEFGPGINIFDARDPSLDKPFSTFDLARREKRKKLVAWELMFYAVSIAIAVPFDLCRSMRFHRDFGLGNTISQGEESIFLFELLSRNPKIDIKAHPNRTVYHPWKMASSAHNYQSLAYFLGWCLRQQFWYVLPYYFYLLCKYTAANVARPKPLYRSILKALLIDFAKGILNTKRVASASY